MSAYVRTLLGGNIEPPTPEGYEQIINYTMLYDEGIEGETAGVWGKDGYAMSGYTINQGTKNADNLYMKVTGDSAISMFGTANKISLDDYSLLGFVNIANDTGGEGKGIFKTFIPNKSDMKSGRVLNGYLGENANKTLVTESVADITGSYYLAMWAPSSSGYTRSGYIYNIFLTKPDDINTLCDKAGVGETDLATLLTDTASLTAIFNSEDAVNFMVAQCTGDFMVGVLNSESAVALLKASPYINTVVGNPHWAKFVMMIPTAQELLNVTLLYDYGDECTDVTGGWTSSGYSRPGSTITSGTKNANSLSVSGVGSGKGQMLGIANAVDVGDYKLVITIGEATGTYTTANLEIAISTSKALPNAPEWVAQYGAQGDKGLQTYDITGKTGNQYFALWAGGVNTKSGNVYFMGLVKSDNWQTWASLGGITATDLNALLADPNLMATLMSNEEACRYMVGCTGDLMVSICNSEVAMNALVSNIAYDYAFDHPVWYKFMTMCPVSLEAMDSVAVTVPTMTSNTSPSGEASASNEGATSIQAYYAFDKNTGNSNYWGSHSSTNAPQWVQYEFTEEIELYSFEFFNVTDGSHSKASEGYISVSTDGTNFEDVYTFTGLAAGTTHRIMLDKPARGKFVRITLTAENNTWDGGNCRVYEANFYGKAVD